ncbi:MAG: hypothetical protein K6G16_10910 [Lachnospiraceae bacterium]|nr:hypothetical protein [Lachnospiraceae bacterium]
MLQAMDNLMIGLKVRWNSFKEEMKSDERGVSNIVATVILILIVVLLAGIFWDGLKEWFTTVWGNITNATTSEINAIE